MKKLLFVAIALIGIIASSCMKDEMKIELTQINDGDIKITVVDKNGSPISDQKVKLGSYYEAIEELNTNSEGIVEFKDILMGTYVIAIDDVMDGGMEYNVFQPVQAINSVAKEYTITPSEYSGNAEITVYDYWTGDILVGINVGIFNVEDASGYEFEDIQAITLSEGVTDENGKITFNNLPFGEYGVLTYMNAENSYIEFYSFYINSKDQTVKRTISFYSN